MTRLIGAVMAVALLVSVAPVMAGDSFHALSRLPAGLSPLDDAQLATIEGGQDINVCVNCANIAEIKQWQDAWQSSTVSYNWVYYGDIEVEQQIEQEQEAEVNQSIN
jgi:hypothetical protein